LKVLLPLPVLVGGKKFTYTEERERERERERKRWRGKTRTISHAIIYIQDSTSVQYH